MSMTDMYLPSSMAPHYWHLNLINFGQCVIARISYNVDKQRYNKNVIIHQLIKHSLNTLLSFCLLEISNYFTSFSNTATEARLAVWNVSQYLQVNLHIARSPIVLMKTIKNDVERQRFADCLVSIQENFFYKTWRLLRGKKSTQKIMATWYRKIFHLSCCSLVAATKQTQRPCVRYHGCL